jgi:hypothetical protein
VEEKDIKNEYDSEEVVDSQILHSTAHGDEDGEDDEEGEGTRANEEIDLVPTRRRARSRRGSAEDSAHGTTPDSMHSDDSENEDTDEAEEVMSGDDGGQTTEAIPSVVSVFFGHAAIVRALDVAESHYFERLEAAERMQTAATPSAPTFSPFGSPSPAGGSLVRAEPPEAQFVRNACELTRVGL